MIINSEEYELDLKKIKPRNVKKSDKYSKQIYKYLKKNPGKSKVYYIQTQDVYNEETKKFEQKEIPFDIDNLNCGYIWIGCVRRDNWEEGVIDWIYGNSLGTIISPSREKYTVFANPWNNKKTVVDVTKQFWEKYIEIGRCIYGHKAFLADDEGQFTYTDDTHRKCNWCGKEEHLEIVAHTYTTKDWIED